MPRYTLPTNQPAGALGIVVFTTLLEGWTVPSDGLGLFTPPAGRYLVGVCLDCTMGTIVTTFTSLILLERSGSAQGGEQQVSIGATTGTATPRRVIPIEMRFDGAQTLRVRASLSPAGTIVAGVGSQLSITWLGD